MRVIKIAPDGNCLFGAICNQLFQLDITSGQHREKVRGLRREVVEYLRVNAWETRVRNCIICRIFDDLPQFSGQDYPSQVRAFTDFLSKDGNWGGEETVMAVANIFKANITIHFEKGASIVCVPHNGMAITSIKIVYRLQDKGHQSDYDSLVWQPERIGNEVQPQLITHGWEINSATEEQYQRSSELSSYTRQEETPAEICQLSAASLPLKYPTSIDLDSNLNVRRMEEGAQSDKPIRSMHGKHNDLPAQSPQSSADMGTFNSNIQGIQIGALVNQNRFECLTPHSVVVDKIKEIPETIRIASWNVRGSSQVDKRRDIDLALSEEQIDLAFLQETKLSPGMASTPNYSWFLCGDSDQKIAYRGVAILITKSLSNSIFKMKKVSNNIACIQFIIKGEPCQIINAYIPGDKRGGDEFSKLEFY